MRAARPKSTSVAPLSTAASRAGDRGATRTLARLHVAMPNAGIVEFLERPGQRHARSRRRASARSPVRTVRRIERLQPFDPLGGDIANPASRSAGPHRLRVRAEAASRSRLGRTWLPSRNGGSELSRLLAPGLPYDRGDALPCPLEGRPRGRLPTVSLFLLQWLHFPIKGPWDGAFVNCGAIPIAQSIRDRPRFQPPKVCLTPQGGPL